MFIKTPELIRDLDFEVDAAIRDISREFDIRKDMGERLRKLGDYEIVIVCDDSGSMITPVDGTQRTRWDELCKIIKIVIRIGVRFDSNGVDIHFLNRSSFTNVKDPKTVDEAFRAPPSGYTPLVPVLNKIFQSKLAARGRDKKLLVFVATDGVPTDEDGNEVVDELERTMRKRQVETTHVSFLLCTDDPACVDYLRKWDQEMPNVDVTDDFNTEVKRICQCQNQSNYRFSYGDYVVKTLVGAIDPEMDSLDELP